jgi:hypothetical protein
MPRSWWSKTGKISAVANAFPARAMTSIISHRQLAGFLKRAVAGAPGTMRKPEESQQFQKTSPAGKRDRDLAG